MVKIIYACFVPFNQIFFNVLVYFKPILFLWDYTSLKFAVANCLPPRVFLVSRPHCNLSDLHCVNFSIYIRSSFGVDHHRYDYDKDRITSFLSYSRALH